MKIITAIGFFALIGCVSTSPTRLDLKFVPSNFPKSELESAIDRAIQGLPSSEQSERSEALADSVAELNDLYVYLQQHCKQAEAALLTEQIFWFGYLLDAPPPTPAISAYLEQRERDFGIAQRASPNCMASIEKYRHG